MITEDTPQNQASALTSQDIEAEEGSRLRAALGVVTGIAVAIAIAYSGLRISQYSSMLPLGLLLGAFAGGTITGMVLRKRNVLAGFLVSTSISIPTAIALLFALPGGLPISTYKSFWLIYAKWALPVVASISASGAAGGWIGGRLAKRKLSRRS